MIIKVTGKTYVNNSIMIRSKCVELQQRGRVKYLDRFYSQRTDSVYKDNIINHKLQGTDETILKWKI